MRRPAEDIPGEAGEGSRCGDQEKEGQRGGHMRRREEFMLITRAFPNPSGAPRSSRLSPAWPIGGAMPRWPYEAPANGKGEEAGLAVPQEPSAM